MNILTQTAPVDDEILGFIGSSSVLSQQGHKVHHLILSGNVNVRRHKSETCELLQDIEIANKIIESTFELRDFPNIQFNIVADIELVQSMEVVIELFQPDFLFTHHPRSNESIKGLAAKGGGESGYHHAEAFQVVFQGQK